MAKKKRISEQRVNGLVDAYHAEGYCPSEIFALLTVQHDVDRQDALDACVLTEEDVAEDYPSLDDEAVN